MSRSKKAWAYVCLIVISGIALYITHPSDFDIEMSPLSALLLMIISHLLMGLVSLFTHSKMHVVTRAVVVLYSALSLTGQIFCGIIVMFDLSNIIPKHIWLNSILSVGTLVLVFYLLFSGALTCLKHYDGNYESERARRRANNLNERLVPDANNRIRAPNQRSDQITLKQIVIKESDFDNIDCWRIPNGNVGKLISHPDDATECVICLQDLRAGENCATLSCHHRYHLKCLVHLKESSSICCLCRKHFEMHYNDLNYPISRVFQ
jgi:hypothetical protein